MFTLAHELAHVWFGSSAAFDLRGLQPASDRTEQTCNRVAAEFLIPESLLRDYWPSVSHESDPFQTIASRFKVSTLVAGRRLLDMGFITRAKFFAFYRTWQRRVVTPTPGRGGGDFYANQNLRIGRRFGETVVRAAKEGRLLYSEAYRLTGLYGVAFQRYADNAFGVAI
jgi:Zn-dependent peptidase ImmA (M78 family)